MLTNKQSAFVKNKSKNKLKSNLKLIVMFGSANNKDFVCGMSDYDFMFVLNNITSNTIKEIHSLMKQFRDKFGCEVDIKPFTIAEFKGGITGKHSFNYFNGWGLYAIKHKYQKIIYKSPDLNMNFKVSTARLKKDALDRVVHYIKKLRRILCSEEYLLRGRVQRLSHRDILKITSSSCKNILAFCLAHKYIFTYRTDDVLKASKKVFKNYCNIKLIAKLFHAKKINRYDEKIINDAYNEIEKLYKKVISE